MLAHRIRYHCNYAMGKYKYKYKCAGVCVCVCACVRVQVPAAAVMQPASNLQPAAASAFPQPAATPATVAQSKPADDSLAKTLSAVQELEFIPSSLGKVEPTATAQTGASTVAPTLSHEEAEKARLERVAKVWMTFVLDILVLFLCQALRNVWNYRHVIHDVGVCVVEVTNSCWFLGYFRRKSKTKQ